MITILGLIFGLRREYNKFKKELIDLNNLLVVYKESLKLLQENNNEYKDENKQLKFRIHSLENLLKFATEPKITQDSYINPMYI